MVMPRLPKALMIQSAFLSIAAESVATFGRLRNANASSRMARSFARRQLSTCARVVWADAALVASVASMTSTRIRMQSILPTDTLCGRRYSCLMASIGDKRDARSAGYIPNATPTATDATTATAKVLNEKPACTCACVTDRMIAVTA